MALCIIINLIAIISFEKRGDTTKHTAECLQRKDYVISSLESVTFPNKNKSITMAKIATEGVGNLLN